LTPMSCMHFELSKSSVLLARAHTFLFNDLLSTLGGLSESKCPCRLEATSGSERSMPLNDYHFRYHPLPRGRMYALVKVYEGGSSVASRNQIRQHRRSSCLVTCRPHALTQRLSSDCCIRCIDAVSLCSGYGNVRKDLLAKYVSNHDVYTSSVARPCPWPSERLQSRTRTYVSIASCLLSGLSPTT
jgi:hypothetical protein